MQESGIFGTGSASAGGDGGEGGREGGGGGGGNRGGTGSSRSSGYSLHFPLVMSTVSRIQFQNDV